MATWGFSRSVLAFASAIIASIPAIGQGSSFPPDPAAICVPAANGAGKIVDKRALAKALLADFPISGLALSGSITITKNDPDTSKRIIAVATPGFCKNNPDCGDADKKSIASIDGRLAGLFGTQQAGFRAPAGVDQNAWFSGPNEQNAMVCEIPAGTAVASTAPILKPPAKESSPIRVRGKVADLYIDRSQNDFKSTSQATLSFAGDGVAKTQTNTLTGVIGYAIPGVVGNERGQRGDLVPYVAVNRVIVNAFSGSKSKPSANETVSLGVTGSLFLNNETGTFGQIINLRPDFLFDLQDDSRLASLNLQWIPIAGELLETSGDSSFHLGLNYFHPLWPGVVSYKPLFDLRLDGGTYTDRGLPAVAHTHVDYLRVGGMAGISLISDVANVPLTFSSSYVGLYAASGRQNVGYFSNTLSFNLFNDYVTPSATYSNGNREDTGKREQLWLVGLSARF
jgi:hypothetical protein